MTTNVMKEKFQYLACAFILDHLQNDVKKTKQMIYKFNVRLSK